MEKRFGSKVLPSQENGHLAVAAARVLLNRQVGPPSAAEIAEMLGWTSEETHVVLRGLVDVGILLLRETPFEAHYELGDHRLLEELKTEAQKEVLVEEVEEFKRRTRSRQEEIETLFRSGEQEKQKKARHDSIEQQFAEFKKRKPRPLP